MNFNKIGKLLLCIFLTNLAGIIGSLFTMSSIGSWYSTLTKPWFTPPNWVFGPVWITLYILMGVSLYLILEKGIKKNKNALTLFSTQLFFNALWSILFFGMRNPLYGLICIFALWLTLLVTIVNFYKISKKAAYLLIPYILWVTVATFLNYYILILN